MHTVKIIHTSDLHLDCRFSDFSSDKSKTRRHELKLSFERIFDVCEDVDIVLICGDIIDNNNYLKSTVTFLIDTFKSHPKVIFFICGGNHDSYNSNAMKDIRNAALSNVVVFSSKAEYMELDDLKVRIYGMSFGDKYHYNSMIDEFNVIDDDYINILMLHGELTNGEKDSRYNPIMIDKIKQSGFDYVALGHTHDFSQIQKAGDTYYAYCGTHEGHGFDECGPKGILYGNIGKKHCDLKFVKTCLREYNKIEIDVTNFRSFDEIASFVYNCVNSNDMFLVTFKGILDENIILDLDILSNLVSCYLIKFVDHTRRNYNLDELARSRNFKGYIAKNVLQMLESDNDSEINVIFDASDYLFQLLDNGGAR